MKRLVKILAVILIVGFSSCKVSQDLDITHDTEMQMGNDAGQNFRNYVHSIREGGNPTGSAKSSGGCGCN